MSTLIIFLVGAVILGVVLQRIYGHQTVETQILENAPTPTPSQIENAPEGLLSISRLILWVQGLLALIILIVALRGAGHAPIFVLAPVSFAILGVAGLIIGLVSRAKGYRDSVLTKLLWVSVAITAVEAFLLFVLFAFISGIS